MAAVSFTGSDQLVLKAHPSAKFGGSTTLIVFRKDANFVADLPALLGLLTGGVTEESGIYWATGDLVYVNTTSAGFTVTTSDGWVALAVTKAAGLAAPRLHKYVYTTGVATHANCAANLNDSAVAGVAGTVRLHGPPASGTARINQSIAALAMYPRVLTDSEIETASQSLMAMKAAEPTWGLWTFEGVSSIQEFAFGGTVTSGAATSVSTTDAPLPLGHPPVMQAAELPLKLVATWDDVRGRVVLTASQIPASATTVTSLERFDTAVLTNGDAVRGGTLGGTDPGAGFSLSDYEYTPGVVNTYRMTISGRTATATVTPAPTTVWLKSIARPFLNRQVTVVGFDTVTLPARGGVLDVIGRREPVAITEVRGSRQYALTLRAADRVEADALELMLSFGDVLYVQPPSASCVVPRAMYAYVGDVSFQRAGRSDGEVRYVTLPLTEVAAPDPSIVGYTITWAGVKSTWATWAAVKAAVPTWLALQEYVAAPADEIVG